MKIKINENETYNIELPEEISSNKFRELLFRLNNINKLLGRDLFSQVSSQPPKTKTYSNERAPSMKRKYTKSKENALEVIKIHYLGTKEEKQKYAEEINYNWDKIAKALHNLKERFNIKSQDIGLIRFPRGEECFWTKETKLEHLGVKNYNDETKIEAKEEIEEAIAS